MAEQPTPEDQVNVLGEPLQSCSTDPETGYLRDGCCTAVPGDRGEHHICVVVTSAFLEFSRGRGNDLMTPRPALDFPGLDPGDRWCLCTGRWIEALEADIAPPVVLAATNEAVLDRVDIDTLRANAADGYTGRQND